MIGKRTRLEQESRALGAHGERSGTPGKRTLVQGLVAHGLLAPPPHAPPVRRVADAGARAPNAAIKVIAYAKGTIVGKPWSAKGRWEGPLPQTYTGTRTEAGWTWDNPDARSVRIGSDLQGHGGRAPEAWAGAAADRIVIYASALDAVTIDDAAEPSDHAPGHARDAQNTQRAGAGDSAPARAVDQAPASHEPGAAGSTAGGGAGRDVSADPHEHDEQLADAFERELGLAADDAGWADDIDAPAAGSAQRARSSPDAHPDGVPEGRTGPDTRLGGTGPGGAQARDRGDGDGSREAGRGGSEGGSRDGERGGSPDGMYGGEGHAGDGGVPSAVALFGGILSVPAALRGFVELALIVSAGDVTGAGTQLFKQGLGKLASAAAARRLIAHEARLAAVAETKRVIQRIATDRRTAAAWARATVAEQQRATRIIYWELQRTYFEGYLRAAKQAKAEAKAALRRAPRASSVQQRLHQAELAEEAATAQPIAGRLPQNHELAGKWYPSELLPPAYRKPGVRFSEAGFPDFSPYAQTLPNGQKSVQIRYTGSRAKDFAAANAEAGYKKIPPGYTWHHHEDMKTMLLIPEDLHDKIKHTGGVATFKHTSGIGSYGK